MNFYVLIFNLKAYSTYLVLKKKKKKKKREDSRIHSYSRIFFFLRFIEYSNSRFFFCFWRIFVFAIFFSEFGEYSYSRLFYSEFGEYSYSRFIFFIGLANIRIREYLKYIIHDITYTLVKL